MPTPPRLRAFLALGLLLLAAWAAVRFTPPLRPDPTPAVRAGLPDQLGEWTGRDILFCQKEDCPGVTSGNELSTDGALCPSCGGPLDTWALGEKKSLPPDTTLVRRRYTHPRSEPVMAAIVLSGRRQNAVHRPRTCLIGQGYRIQRTARMGVPLPGREPLRLTVLDLLRHERGPTGTLADSPSFYAYWFAGGGHETADHSRVALYGAWDRIVRGFSPRWACVTIAGSRLPGSDGHEAAVREFVTLLHASVAPAATPADRPAQ